MTPPVPPLPMDPDGRPSREFMRLVEAVAQSAHSFRWALNGDAFALWSWHLAQLATAREAGEAERDSLRRALADAIGGLQYIEQGHGRLYGVGWDRVYAYRALLPDPGPDATSKGVQDG